MADDLASFSKYTGRDPVHSGELNSPARSSGARAAELQPRCSARLSMSAAPRACATRRSSEAAGQARWHCLDHPQPPGDLDAQIGKLIGTTRNTINAISRTVALEHRQHSAEGSGYPRPVLAARTRCCGCQGRKARRRTSDGRKRRSSSSATTMRGADRRAARRSAMLRPRPRLKRRKKPKRKPGSSPSAAAEAEPRGRMFSLLEQRRGRSAVAGPFLGGFRSDSARESQARLGLVVS